MRCPDKLAFAPTILITSFYHLFPRPHSITSCGIKRPGDMTTQRDRSRRSFDYIDVDSIIMSQQGALSKTVIVKKQIGVSTGAPTNTGNISWIKRHSCKSKGN